MALEIAAPTAGVLPIIGAVVVGTLDANGVFTQLTSGIDYKGSVRVATTAAGTLATSFENGDTVDGIVLATGDRILIKDQAAPAANGIYVVAATGAPARASDFDTWAEIPGALVGVEVGTANADTAWLCTSDAGGTLGTTAITFTQFGAGVALPLAANSGGTGVANNSASTLTISGNFATTFTVSGVTTLTLPTSGTVAVLTNILTYAYPAAPGFAGNINLDSTAADRSITWSDAGGIFATILSQASGDKLVLTATALSLTSTSSLQLGQTAGTDRISVQHAAYADSGTVQGVSKAFSFVSTWWNGSAVVYSYSTVQGNVDVSGNPQLSLYLPGADSTTAPGTEQVRFTKEQILVAATGTSPAYSFIGFPTAGMDTTASDQLLLVTNGVTRITVTSGGITLASSLAVKGGDHYAIYNTAYSGTRISTITASTWIFLTSDIAHLTLSSNGVAVGNGIIASFALAGGTITTDTTQTGNIGADEDTLQTVVVAANTLGTNGDTYAFMVSGTIASSINAKRIRIKFGATTIFDTGATGIPASTAQDWRIEGEVIRTGAATQKCTVSAYFGTALVSVAPVDYTIAAETLSGAVTFLITGEATTTNDIVKEIFKSYLLR